MECKIYIKHNVQYWIVLRRLLRETMQGQERTVRIVSTQIRWLSGQSDRKLDLMRGGRRCSKLSYLKEPNQKQAWRKPKIGKVLWVRWSREMMFLMMMMMIWWEPVCHKIEWQQHCKLRNCSAELSINSYLHIPDRWICEGGEGDGWSTFYIEQFQLGFTPPSWSFMR